MENRFSCQYCDVTCTPRCPNYVPKKIGLCAQCGETVWNIDKRWEDDGENIFCSEDCAKKYYGIREVG